jgi:hypothetical protein
MRYLLDPADILGADCGFETFGALKRAEMRISRNKFTSRDLILRTWDELPSPRSLPAKSSGQGATQQPTFQN